jgi:8-oxo-dGTP diphosphatase
MMKPVFNHRGNALLEFIPMENEESLEPTIHSPLTASLVLAEYNGNLLLVFDKYKEHWEFPGGAIEPGESPQDCAVRELMEESGQSPSKLDFVGVAKFLMNDTIMFAAIYLCHLRIKYSFQANDEIGSIVFWDFSSDIGLIDEIVRYLATLIMHR